MGDGVATYCTSISRRISFTVIFFAKEGELYIYQEKSHSERRCSYVVVVDRCDSDFLGEDHLCRSMFWFNSWFTCGFTQTT